MMNGLSWLARAGVCCALLCFASHGPNAAAVTASPTATLFVDLMPLDLGPYISPTEKGWILEAENILVGLTADAPLALINRIFVTLNPDPFIDHAISVTDLGAPSTFSLTISLPITPTGPPITASASLSGTLQDGGDGFISLTPSSPLTGAPEDPGSSGDEIQVFTINLPLINVGLDLGPAATLIAPIGPISYGPFNASGPLPLVADFLQVDVNFIGSGNGDTYALNGLVQVEGGGSAVPEAGSSFVILLGSCGCLGFFGRPRSKQKSLRA
jgi:hypothetical protein